MKPVFLKYKSSNPRHLVFHDAVVQLKIVKRAVGKISMRSVKKLWVLSGVHVRLAWVTFTIQSRPQLTRWPKVMPTSEKLS